jgi:hypothetical protein
VAAAINPTRQNMSGLPSPRAAASPVRLGHNHGGYRGERIDIDAVLAAALAAAGRHGWRVERLAAGADLALAACVRRVPGARRRLYVSTGIHGDEPAGPVAAGRLLEENRWPAATDVWLVPCLNPTGFRLGRRENRQGLDLNRDYRHGATEDVRAHVAWLQEQPAFDEAFCLHEDWEAKGFYLYELNPDDGPSRADAIIRGVAAICPIDPSEVIEERPACGGVIRPQLDPGQRPQWPEAFYLIQHKTRQSYTLEAPSDFPLPVRVDALVTAVRVALDGA